MLYARSAEIGEGRKQGAVGELREQELGGHEGRDQRGKKKSRMGQNEEESQKRARSVKDEGMTAGGKGRGSGRERCL